MTRAEGAGWHEAPRSSLGTKPGTHLPSQLGPLTFQTSSESDSSATSLVLHLLYFGFVPLQIFIASQLHARRCFMPPLQTTWSTRTPRQCSKKPPRILRNIPPSSPPSDPSDGDLIGHIPLRPYALDAHFALKYLPNFSGAFAITSHAAVTCLRPKPGTLHSTRSLASPAHHPRQG